jgi:hypothetical protein
MRIERMNQIPVISCDDAAYLVTMCSKFAAPRESPNVPVNSNTSW